MTTIQDYLAEQNRLAADATDGPWHEDRFTNGLITACGRVDANGDQLAVAEHVYMLGDREFIAAARESVPRLVAALEAAVALHAEEKAECIGCSYESVPSIGFRGVSVPWPCPTILAIEAALGGEGDAG